MIKELGAAFAQVFVANLGIILAVMLFAGVSKETIEIFLDMWKVIDESQLFMISALAIIGYQSLKDETGELYRFGLKAWELSGRNLISRISTFPILAVFLFLILFYGILSATIISDNLNDARLCQIERVQKLIQSQNTMDRCDKLSGTIFWPKSPISISPPRF